MRPRGQSGRQASGARLGLDHAEPRRPTRFRRDDAPHQGADDATSHTQRLDESGECTRLLVQAGVGPQGRYRDERRQAVPGAGART